MSSKTYLGNPNLKGMGVNVDWTPEAVEEYKKCMKSPLYFIKNYVEIQGVNNIEQLDEVNGFYENN